MRVQSFLLLGLLGSAACEVGPVAEDVFVTASEGRPGPVEEPPPPPPDETPVPSAACGSAPTLPGGASTPRSLQHDGIERTYLVRPPSSADGETPQPLVILLHGGFGHGAQIEEQSLIDPHAEAAGAVMAFPDGVPQFPGAESEPLKVRTWNAGGCCGFSLATQVDDVGFLTSLIDAVGAETCIDLRRVYMTGFSNGGMMTHRMACERADRLAAVAPISGTMTFTQCSPSRPLPMMHTHGTADPNAPFAGGPGCGFGTGSGVESSIGAPNSMAIWRDLNQCEGPNSLFFAEGNGTCERQGACAEDLILCTIEGGNHSWPSGVANPPVQDCKGGAQSLSFGMSALLFSFFGEHRLP